MASPYIWARNNELKPELSPRAKAHLTQMAEALVNDELMVKYIERAKKGSSENYIFDIYAKWQKNCFYFCAKYRSPQNGTSFDVGFARMEYRQSGRYDLAYFRHTGKWRTVERGLTAAGAMKKIAGGGHYAP